MIKTFLKTTAAVATLMVGSQSWGSLKVYDEADVDKTAGKPMVERFSALVFGAGTTASLASVTMTQNNSEVFIVTDHGATAPVITAVTLSKDSHLYLMGAVPPTVTAVNGPSSGKGYVHLRISGVTFSANPDGKIVLVADYLKGGIALSGVAGAIDADLDVRTVTTISTATSLTGKLTGKGNLNLPAAFTLSGDVSRFEGTIIPVGALTLTNPLSKGVLELPNQTVTVSKKGSLALVRATAAGTLTANEDITINELDLRQAGITLVPASGKRITIKKLTNGSDGDITINGAGSVKIENGSTSGSISVNAGSLIQ